MDIQKVIELNKEAVASLRQNKHPDHADAVQLGIEFARYIILIRETDPDHSPGLFHGESEKPASP